MIGNTVGCAVGAMIMYGVRQIVDKIKILKTDKNMKRRALLIMNPGQVGASNYAPSVMAAMNRYKNFLKSPTGGYWQDEEIIELERSVGPKSLQSSFAFKMRDLNQSDVDYSLIVFIGHGGSAMGVESFQLEDGETLPIECLLYPPHNPKPLKRTVVIDACRTYAAVTPMQIMLESRAFSGDGQIQGVWCKDYYNSIIENTPAHIELLQSTQYGQYAKTSISGTAFTDALFDTISNNSSLWNTQALNDKYGRKCIVFPDILDDVKNCMAGWGQTPQFTNPSDACFPVYAVVRPITKVVNGGGSVVGIIND